MKRLIKIINPDNGYTLYEYDARGNANKVGNPNGAVTVTAYNAANRIDRVIRPENIVTKYAYDKRGNLRSVTDPNNNTTAYEYDVQNRLIKTMSPDTGITAYTYDNNGNLKSRTDAQGVTKSYAYDELNRLKTKTFPDATQNITYTYDTCVNGKGRLCVMQDQSGTTSYEYTLKGQLAKETKVISGVTYITRYTYDKSDSIKTITYPSGRVVTYNSTNDRINSILNNVNEIVSNVTYKPFGPMNAFTYGNGIQQTIEYDQKYFISSIKAGSVQDLTYAYDLNGNITEITNNLDAGKSKTYAYDALDRLTGAIGPWGNLTYTYDGVGNRLTEDNNAAITNYAYEANKLKSTNGTKVFNFSFDNNGNTITENSRQYLYNQNQRLIRVADGATIKGNYIYNGKGQRVKKIVNGQTTIYHYDIDGQMIEESTGTAIIDYVFLNNNNIAKIEGNEVYYYHNIHLGTPQKMTDSNGIVVWYGEFLPFGEPHAIIGTKTTNKRFPGQYYDEETGLNYNYFRDYNAAIGRYIEADPIGIREGENHLYSYGANNPNYFVDLRGLIVTVCIDQKGAHGAGHVGFAAGKEKQTQGFYGDGTRKGPGKIQEDAETIEYWKKTGDYKEFDTTPACDNCMIKCRETRRKSCTPPNICGYDLTKNNCAHFVQDCLRDCKKTPGCKGLPDVAVTSTVFPRQFYENLPPKSSVDMPEPILP